MVSHFLGTGTLTALLELSFSERVCTNCLENPGVVQSGMDNTTTGYTKFGARYYDPTIGRFTQPDPSAQETNTYLYAAANPINFVDSTGLLVGELGGTFCLFACISLGLAQDDVTGAYAITGGFGIGTPGVAANVKVGPGEVSTSAGPEGSCGVEPITLSLGSGGGGLGLSSGLSSGFCTVQWNASLRIS